MANPRVSIIVPAFKSEQYIGEALESIGNQSYKEWELLVIEDHWKDKTEEIVSDFSKKYSDHQIKFIQHPKNLGLGAARNTGIRESCGEYIAFLDHDDIWLSNHLMDAVSALKKISLGIAYSTTNMFQDGTNIILGTWGPTEQEIAHFPVSLYQRSFITPSAVVLHKAVFETVGLFDVDPLILFAEDYDFWLRAARLRIPFIHLNKITCLYRKNHSGAATSNLTMMLERNLYVIQKHSDWESISAITKKNIICDYYMYIGLSQLKQKPLTALYLWGQSQKVDPFNFHRIVFVLKAVILSVLDFLRIRS